MMRFGWNSKQVKVDEIAVSDAVMHILDKDGVKHTSTREGYVDWFIDYYSSVQGINLARAYLSGERDFVKTDAGLYIPGCNIKHIEIEVTNKRTEPIIRTVLGIKDWTIMEWFTLIFFGGIALLMLLIAVVTIYGEIHK